MARRVINSINWSGISERIPESERKFYVLFKAKSDAYFQRMLKYPEEPPKINWAFYKASIPVPGLVDKFQKEYESLSVPYPEDKYTSLVDVQEKETMAQVAEFCSNMDKSIAELKVKYEEKKNQIPYEEMTMEELKDALPDVVPDPLVRPSIWPHGPDNKPGPNPNYVPETH